MKDVTCPHIKCLFGFVHCLHETCKDSNCKGNHTLNGHTEQCVDPYFCCCICFKDITLEDFEK